MRGSHRVGTSFLALGTLIVLLIALASMVAVAPVRAAAATPRAATQAPAEASKVVLGDTGIDGPALWTSNPGAPTPSRASVLAWTGSDAGHSLNIMQSSDGVTYGGKVTFAESSDYRPAVAAQGTPTTVVLAWTGTDPSHSLNLLCQGPACGTGVGSEKKYTFISENSFTSPALVQFGDGFLLAWAGTDAHHSLNILPFHLTTSGAGFQVGAKTILSQFGSIAGPSLALNPHNNQLLLTWSATTPTGQLAFATSSDGVGWNAAQTLEETSGAGPSGFAVASGDMPTYWLAWTGTDSAHSVNVRFTQSSLQWPPSGEKSTFSDTAYGGPVLGYMGDVGKMLLAWTGTDSAHHLNIATLTTTSATNLDQRIDTFIASLSTAQQVGQTLMLAVYADSYNANLDQALTQWSLGSAIVYTNYNGGPLKPTSGAGLQQLTQALRSHAGTPLLLAIDEEGGAVDRLAPYYGATPSARQLAATGDPQAAYAQAQTDATRMRAIGLNVDFAPVVDVDQGGGVGQSRTFGTSADTVTTYAGEFLDGLQQQGVAGALKHWPGLGAATGNPDETLPTITQSQAQMNAIDFAPFRALLSHQPGMIMATTVLARAFDAQNPAMLSPTLVNGVLRGQLGYQGVIVTDALDAQGLIQYMQQQGYGDPAAGLAEASVRSFLAGDDLIEAPIEQDRLAAVVAAMTAAVQSGRVSPARLQASVHRIIRLKVELGVMTLP